MRGRLVIVLAAGVFMAVPLSAHHGGAVFDTGKSVILKGTVTQWVYSNPHLLLMLDVKGEDGAVVKWVAETQAPNIMYPAGYRKDSFKAGDEVTVTVQPAQNGRPIGRILKAITANGTTLGVTADAPIYPPRR
jgi:hypothetical protein